MTVKQHIEKVKLLVAHWNSFRQLASELEDHYHNLSPDEAKELDKFYDSDDPSAMKLLEIGLILEGEFDDEEELMLGIG